MTEEELEEADAHSYIVVCYFDTTDDGRPYWLYLAVKPSKYREFMCRTENHQPVRFKDYGDILRYGFDKDIPLEVKREMKEKYGCDDHYMEFIIQDIQNAENTFQEENNQRIANIVAMLKKKQP